MFRPSDLQLVILTTAAQRADGSLMPPADSVAGQAARIRRAIPALIKNGLSIEAVTTDSDAAYRDENDVRYGVFITGAGRSVIGAEPDMPPPVVISTLGEECIKAIPAKKPTKAALVIELLTRTQGATLDELVSATGWLPHTTRAALTGLRKKGHAIDRGKRGDITCYVISAAA